MKDVTYHRSAIFYNEELAARAEALVDEVEHPEVKKWCRSVGKQHRFHAKRHQASLAKLEREPAEASGESGVNVEAQVAVLTPSNVPVEATTLAPAEVEVDVDLSKEN
jgi:hypothetical protein